MTVYHSNVQTLHITNGSCAGDQLKTFVDGPLILACDVLHEGPVPRVDGDAWYDVRARFLGADDGSNIDAIRADLAASDRTIAGHPGPILLWFEHDLFDQLALIRTLDVVLRSNRDGEHVPAGVSRTVEMICIDRFPGVERFIGLGQLDASQLASLYPLRRPVTPDQFALAAAAWDAFRAPDPRALIDVARDARALPFLSDALWRFLAEYPSVENGLTRTETLALTALTEAPMTGGALFGATQRREARPFIGDSTFFSNLVALADARVPLVAISGPPERVDLRPHTLEILDAGRDVLAGRADRVALNGIDMWRGGVHLSGGDRLWRWDASRKTLVS
jgi:hypothetical protein